MILFLILLHIPFCASDWSVVFDDWFQPFEKISEALVNETFAAALGSHIMFQYIGGKLHVYDPYRWCVCSRTAFDAAAHGYIQSRCKAIVSLINATVSFLSNNSDFEIVMSLDDLPAWNAIDFNLLSLAGKKRMHPGFGAIRCAEAGTIPFPIFGSHGEWSFAGHPTKFDDDLNEEHFQRRHATAVFRGAPDRGCSRGYHRLGKHANFYELFEAQNRTCGRRLLLELASEMPDEINFVVDDFLTLKQQQERFRFVISAEGWAGWTDRLLLLLASEMVVLNQDHPCSQWFEPLLRPFEHFIPVRNDFRDVATRVRWARENPSATLAILRHAHTFANKHLTQSGILAYTVGVLSRYSRAMTYHPVAKEHSLPFADFLALLDEALSIRRQKAECTVIPVVHSVAVWNK